jgi:FtsP/CotA-like multicopper oxidase with cupredoxin domain
MSDRCQLRALSECATAIAVAAGIMLWSSLECRAQSAQPPTPRVFELSLVNGRLTANADTIRVKKGDAIELRWTSDRPITLHLHGYDIERRATPQSPAAMTFKANIAGRFPVSEHRDGMRHERALLYLEVHP